MTTPVYTGQRFVWGVPTDLRPIAGLPPGRRWRLRLRPREFATVVVATEGGAERYCLLDRGDRWELGHRLGVNLRRTSA